MLSGTRVLRCAVGNAKSTTPGSGAAGVSSRGTQLINTTVHDTHRPVRRIAAPTFLRPDREVVTRRWWR